MKRFPRAVWLLALIHLCLFGYLAFSAPMAFLMDDAFYSLTVAANIADGEGISYGGFPTNGFQPLYAFVMVPLFKLFEPHRMALLKMALLFCGLCSTLGLFVLFRIAERYSGRSAGVLAVMLGSLSVNLLSHSASGLETSLHALLFLILVDRYASRRNEMTSTGAVGLGILLGLLAYARLDACFVFIAIAIDRFVIHRSNLGAAVKENLAIFVPACLLLAPWFAWNLATFETVTQSSGAFHHWRGIQTQGFSYALPGFAAVASIKLASLAIKLPLEPLFGYRALVLGPAEWLLGVEKLHRNFLVQLWEENPFLALVLIAASLAVLGALVLLGREGLRRVRDFKPLAWVLVAITGAAVYYPLVQINYSMRHFYAYSLLMAAPVAVFLAGLLRLNKDGPVLAGKGRAVLIGLLAIAVFRCGPFDPKLLKSNPAGFSNIAEIRRLVPPGASIGYTDCGFYGFFLPEYNVVNLDGIMNFEALAALRENSMSTYLLAHNVNYVLALDNFHKEFREQFETNILPVLEKHPDSDFIYRVTGPGAESF
jgi:hypothetical protein